jgi:hypothetical protein
MTSFLELLRILLSWPVAVLVLVLYFLRTFKVQLNALLTSRSVKMQGYGVSIELASETQLALPEPNIPKPDENRPVAYVREHPAEVVAEFIRTYNAYFFERSYNNIFGSQIRVLEHLLAKGNEGETYIGLHPFYAQYWTGTPLQFPNYLGFLKNTNFIRYDGDPIQVRITPYGTDFLTYIQGQYPTTIGLKPF